MTCIAWDGETLASDSRVTNDNGLLITDKYNKLQKLDDVEYFGDCLLYMGISGALADRDKLLSIMTPRHLLADVKYDHDLFAIVVGRDYVYRLESDGYWLVRYDKSVKLACGSGSSYAISAMSLGLNAVQAVKHACKLDVYCGGRVRSVKPSS